MWTHPGDAALMDVVEGTASDRVRGHVAGCAECRRRTDDVRDTLAWSARAAVPEPVPAYWDVLRRRIAVGVGDERPSRRVAPLWTAAALATAAATLVVVLPVTRAPRPVPSVAPAAVLPAWSALPPADDDAGLAILEHAAPTAVAVTPSLECADVAECVASLSDDESEALADALRAQLRPGQTL